MTWQFVLTGLLIGTLVGMTGMGGGSLMTPILVIVFGFKPTLAVGTDILHGAIFKTVGAIRHRQLGTVHHQLSGWMLLGSAPASLARRRPEHAPEGPPGTLMNYLLGGALLFGASGLVAKSFVRKKVIGEDDRFDMVWRDRFAAIAIGLVGGFIVGLTSVGSGTFFGLTMLFVFPLRAHKVVGTDILHAAALLYVAGFGPHHRRQRRHARGRLAADRLDPRRPDRQPLLGASCPRRCCASRSRTCSRSAASSSCNVPNVYLVVALGDLGAARVVVDARSASSGAGRPGAASASRPGWREPRTKLAGRCPACSRPCSSSALLGGTAAAFAVTQGLKIEPSPILAPHIDKVFSPVCDCDSRVATIQFKLRKPDRVRLEIVDSDGDVVRDARAPGMRLRRGDGDLHLERPRRPGRLRRRRASTSRAST